MNCLLQSSPMRTGSTVLANALEGSYAQNEKINYSYGPSSRCSETSTTVIKTHDNDLQAWKDLNPGVNIITVGTARENKATKNADVIFNYEELSNPGLNSTKDVCELVAGRLDPIMGTPADVEQCIARLDAMNKRGDEIKDQPFKFYDETYHIHGTHRRNRTQNRPVTEPVAETAASLGLKQMG